MDGLELMKSYENEIFKRGLSYEKPRITCDSTKWEELAKKKLAAEPAGYVYGSASTRETVNKNLDAFHKWSIVPRRLVKCEYPDTKIKIFGENLPFPIALAPIGVQRIFNPDGEVASASAARDLNIPYIMSTASATSIEDVAKANKEGPRWYQLYWPSNEYNFITESILRRAKESGFKVLVVTLDTYLLGWRPSDLDNAYNPFLRPDAIGSAIGFSDPEFRKHFKSKYGMDVEQNMAAAAVEWAKCIFPGVSHDWDDLKFLKKHWDGPIVLKGIQSVADAKKAAEIGMDGIVVSNHGGRQQDGGVASLKMLPKVVEAVGKRLTVIFDSGIRGGADIVKALALGADMVLIGRPYIYGMALGGYEGVIHVLRCLISDFLLTLHLSGVTSIDKTILNADLLENEV